MIENEWFGPEPWAPICDALQRGPTPTGCSCEWCHEEIVMGDCGLFILHLGQKCERRIFHRECQMRMVVGSLAHVEVRCSCVGGSDERPRGMTMRQEAIAVWERVRR